MKSRSLKKRAIYLRKKGYSYNMITEKTGMSKSTLCCWLKEIPFTPNKFVLARIKEGTRLSAQTRNDEKIRGINVARENARKELGILTRRDLWLLGIGLYIGEGSKVYETIRIVNSDPEVIKLAVAWFQTICGLSKKNITMAVHLYPDSDTKASLKYWLKITGLPKAQVRKTQIDKRPNKSEKKRQHLPYGTVHLRVVSNGNPNFGVRLHRKINGWIQSCFENLERVRE